MTAIPLINVAQFSPILTLLSDVGAPIDKLLDESNLPGIVYEHPTTFVSAASAWAFIHRASFSQGIPELGWRGIEAAPLESLGNWAWHVVRAPTLRAAIAALTYWYGKEVPFIRTGLSDGGDHAWLWRARLVNLRSTPGDEPAEQYSLGRLIKVVRLVAGEQWIPTHVKLESRRGDSRLPPSTLPGTQICYDQPCVAIAVPWNMLDRSLPQPDPTRSTREPRGGFPTPSSSYSGSLQQALAPLLAFKPLTLGLCAEVTRTSASSVKRRLAEEGMSWRRVLDKLRLEASLEMLSNPSVPTSEVGLAVGYSDQPHFTRAFRRWTGVTPSEFRRSVPEPRGH